MLDKVDYQRCIPKGAIKRIKGNRITFNDGTEEVVDVIIQCTGYRTEFPLLPEEFRNVSLVDNYKYIFNIEDPTLAFVGYVRPVVGSTVHEQVSDCVYGKRSEAQPRSSAFVT